MRLKTVRLTEFKSIRDSQNFDVGQVTCLVGKNESGKTAMLQALYRLNPVVPGQARFNPTEDYPRAYVKRYERAVKAKEIEPQTVVEATFLIGGATLEKIESVFGEGVMPKRELILSRGYSNELHWRLEVNEGLAISHLAKSLEAEQSVRDLILQRPTLQTLAEVLAQNARDIQARHSEKLAEANAMDDSEPEAKQEAILKARAILEPKKTHALRSWAEGAAKSNLASYIYETYLEPQLPFFLYFDEFYQMEGHVNIPALKARQQNDQLQDSDRAMLGLIDLAGLELDELVSPPNTQDLVNNLEGASNDLTKQMMPYWSQNRHIALRFDIRPGAPGDPEGMRDGMNLWANVYDSAHSITMGVGTRSRGFIWFFSFLAWFSQHRKSNRPLILLLDEPALFLHAAAQSDLLRYIDAELKDHNQVIYTTHSPFMVDAKNFDRVRMVQDRSLEAENALPEDEEGTKVYSDPLQVDERTLFPLQGALGYDLARSLFVGRNNLIVKGVSDLVYIQTISGLLESAGREGLNAAWTITPVGGSDKLPTFVALLGAQKGVKVATLIDLHDKDQQQIEKLYERKLLSKLNVRTFTEFTGKPEADIEDMLEPDFYLELVNREYAAHLAKPITVGDLPATSPRILARVGEYLESHPLTGTGFNRYRPARYLSEHILYLKENLSSATLDRFEAAFKALNSLP